MDRDLSELDQAILAEEMGWDYLPACDEVDLLLMGLPRLRPRRSVTPQLRPSTLRRANDFVATHHRHCGRTARNGGKFAIEATDAGGAICGVVIVGNPLSATFMDGTTAEITRLCVDPEFDAPNLCSMLYGAAVRAWKAMGGTRLLTYTLESESGASLRGAGFRVAAQCPPSAARWTDRGGSRRHLPIYDAAKIRWEKILT